MKTRSFFILLIICFAYHSKCQISANNVNQDLLSFIKGKDSLVDAVINQQSKFKLQIIYGKTIHSEKDSVKLINTYLTDSIYYFYPASAIKLPCAILALEKLHELKIPEKHYFRIGNEYTCGNTSHIIKSQKQKSSYHNILQLMLAVSDNAAYNSVYEFLTPNYISSTLKKRGLSSIHIYKRFAGCSLTENLKLNPVSLYNLEDRIIYKQKSSVIELSEMAKNYNFDPSKLLGEKHEFNSIIKDSPFDFNYTIETSLMDLHSSLSRLVYPETVEPRDRWKITTEERSFLLKNIGAYPRELNVNPYTDTTKYPDNLLKYIVVGNQRNNKGNNVRTFSKIGISYGFITETAYVVDFEQNIDFFLSVNIYVNENEILNDNIYEYESIARPFLSKLGNLILEYENGQIKSGNKNLSSFKELLFNE